MTAAAEQERSVPSLFRLRFEYVHEGGATLRSEKIFNAGDLLDAKSAEAIVTREAATLHGKIVKAMKDDGYIPPPSNVIHVDFKRGKRQ